MIVKKSLDLDETRLHGCDIDARLTAPHLVRRLKQKIHSVVMAGLVPAIHDLPRHFGFRGCPAQGRARRLS
jgi:hypothetical protein